MIKEIRKIKRRGLQNYVRKLYDRGYITKIINDKGYICYDTDELKKYKATARVGRPPKKEN